MGEVVEVVYALPDVQRIVEVQFRDGLTALEAVEQSGLLAEYPEIHADPLVLGIFGERVDDSHELKPGNRVEICRPLQQDPRDTRSQLAAIGGVMGRPRDGREN